MLGLWQRKMKNVVILVAAGRGLRVGGEIPKQYRQLAGTSVIARSIAAFAAHPAIDAVPPVIHPGDRDRFAEAAGALPGKCLEPVAGGETRQDSVLAGLEALAGHRPECVLIHDAARPLVSRAIIDGVLARSSGVPPALPLCPSPIR